MEQAKLLRLSVKAREITSKEDGKKYIVFETYKKDNTRMTLKFTKEVLNKPTTEGMFTIEVLSTNANISNKKRYPEMWVKQIERYVTEEEMEEARANKLAELFDTAE